MFRRAPQKCICGKALDITEQQVDRWIRDNTYSKPELAGHFKKHIGGKPVCQWLGDWNVNPRKTAKEIAEHAKANNSLFQIVIYNIPNRDNGGFSAGGSTSRGAYISWVRDVTAGIGSTEGIIIVEPDALAHAHELDPMRREQRLDLIREVVTLLRNRCRNAHIYIDAGHPVWLHPYVATELLLKAGVRLVDGIALNVSNSQTTESCYRYGVQITEKISERHGIMIDTSRNGAGPPPPHITGVDAWANPPTNRLGDAPTLKVKPPNIFCHRLHGLLWIKIPGESDGAYKGAPAAGVFWPSGAKRLIG